MVVALLLFPQARVVCNRAARSLADTMVAVAARPLSDVFPGTIGEKASLLLLLDGCGPGDRSMKMRIGRRVLSMILRTATREIVSIDIRARS